jgi:hypothetical protein
LQMLVLAKVKLALIAAPDKQEKELLLWIFVNEFSTWLFEWTSLSKGASKESHWYPKLTFRSVLLFPSSPRFSTISHKLNGNLVLLIMDTCYDVSRSRTGFILESKSKPDLQKV